MYSSQAPGNSADKTNEISGLEAPTQLYMTTDDDDGPSSDLLEPTQVLLRTIPHSNLFYNHIEKICKTVENKRDKFLQKKMTKKKIKKEKKKFELKLCGIIHSEWQKESG